jgi:hypothetical protein
MYKRSTPRISILSPSSGNCSKTEGKLHSIFVNAIVEFSQFRGRVEEVVGTTEQLRGIVDHFVHDFEGSLSWRVDRSCNNANWSGIAVSSIL